MDHTFHINESKIQKKNVLYKSKLHSQQTDFCFASWECLVGVGSVIKYKKRGENILRPYGANSYWGFLRPNEVNFEGEKKLVMSLFLSLDKFKILISLKGVQIIMQIYALFYSNYTNFYITLWQEISVTKFQNWKIWDDSSKVWLCRGVFNFFCKHCFHEEICETKWTLFKRFPLTRKEKYAGLKNCNNSVNLWDIVEIFFPYGHWWPSLKVPSIILHKICLYSSLSSC